MVMSIVIGEFEAFSGEWDRWRDEQPERPAENTPPLTETWKKREIRLSEWTRPKNNDAKKDNREINRWPSRNRNENRWTAGGLFRPPPISLFTARCPRITAFILYLPNANVSLKAARFLRCGDFPQFGAGGFI